jgi:hypothetical protein
MALIPKLLGAGFPIAFALTTSGIREELDYNFSKDRGIAEMRCYPIEISGGIQSAPSDF